VPESSYFSNKKPRLMILDDLITEINKETLNSFIRGSHHSNYSVFIVSQNLFFADKFFRNISLNCHILIVFKSLRAADQINYLARQIMPNDKKFFLDSFADATKRAHGYLLINLTQSEDDDLRIRTNIIPQSFEPFNVVYLSNKRK